MEQETKQDVSQSKQLFDESDDDSDEAPDTTKEDTIVKDKDAYNPLTNEKVTNAQLFGSDDDDSDSEEEEENLNNHEVAQDSTEKEPFQSNPNHTTQEEEESDVEFQEADADITGRRAPTPPPVKDTSTENATISSSSFNHIAVYNLLLPQLENNNNVSLHMAQLPKILGIQPEAFSPITYNAAVEDAEYKGRMASMIRWRYIPSKDGKLGEFERDPNTNKLRKESNAKIVKWSDGTYGLVVGDEVFDMDEFSFLHKASGKKKKDVAVPAGSSQKVKDFLYLTQKAKAILDDEDGNETQPIGTILQGVNHLTSKFIPRPASLQSAAHKAFVLNERSKVMKRAKIAEYDTFVDPEKQKAERIRNKEDLMKQEKRSGGAYRTGGKRRIGMHRNYLEEDDERYDSINIKGLKRGIEDDMDYGSDESDEEDEWINRKKRVVGNSRRNRNDDDDEEQFVEDDVAEEESEEEIAVGTDEDDEEINLRKKPMGGSVQRKAPAMFDDNDDDDDSE
jgi:RNA polymerase-associated protein LEO1